MRFFKTLAVALSLVAGSASAATFSYEIVLESVTGDGPGLGFFNTNTPGATGTGGVIVDETLTDYVDVVEQTFFSAQLIGGTAGSLFLKTVVQDGATGTLTVNGFLGGLTGSFAGVDISADTYEFVYSGYAYSSITTGAEMAAYLDTVGSMSGFFSGFMIPEDNPDAGFRQQVNFTASVSEVPLPAGGLLLLSGLGFLALRRRS